MILPTLACCILLNDQLPASPDKLTTTLPYLGKRTVK